MIRSCLLSRQELVTLIKKSPKTHDNHYFFPRFKELVLIPGEMRDNDYFYDRSVFCEKICFSESDIKAFLSTKSMKYDIELNRFINNKLTETLKGYENLHVKDKIPNKNYTLGELIDTSIYFIKYKYT